MKKRLFLLPLLAVGMLCGCGEEEASGGNSPTPPPVNPTDDPVGHQHSYSAGWTSDENGHWHVCSGCSEKGSYAAHVFSGNTCTVCGYEKPVTPPPGPAAEYELVGSVNCVNFADCVNKSADPVVFQKNGCSITISQGTNTKQTIADAVSASKTYEFRCYAYFNIAFACDTPFAKLVVKSAAPYNGSTYYFDFNNDKNELIPNLVSNTLDESSCKSTIIMSQATSGFNFNVYHQTRLDTVEFYKIK